MFVCRLAEVIRAILLLNDSSVIETIFGDQDLLQKVVGMFEYDPALKSGAYYRKFLFETATLQEVVSFDYAGEGSECNEEEGDDLRGGMRLVFRLKYLRDIMLHPTIDEPGVSTINSMIMFTSVEICQKVPFSVVFACCADASP